MTITQLSSASTVRDPIWPSASEVIRAAELLYAPSETHSALDRHRLVRDLVKQASLQFIRQKRPDEAFRLLSVVQIPPDPLDADIFHLRNSLLLHEQKRVIRIRRLLKTLLICVLTYLLLIASNRKNPAERSRPSASALPFWPRRIGRTVCRSPGRGIPTVPCPCRDWARTIARHPSPLPNLGWMVLPVIGLFAGSLVGWITTRFAPEAAGSGIPYLKGVLIHVRKLN